MKCQRCGQCCVTAIISVEKARADLQELGKWLECHRCSLEYFDSADGTRLLGIRIPLVCQHLGFDQDTGLASCGIYETRPTICREYRCKRTR